MSSIEYRVLVPGQRHFDCTRLYATISTASCADRFTRACTIRDWREGRYAVCARCQVGQLHANEASLMADLNAEPRPLPDLASGCCVRCGRSDLRIVAANQLCIGCYNRAAEAKRGYNARGNPMRDYIMPRPRLVGVIEPAGRSAWRAFEGQTHTESLVRASRAGHKIHASRPGRTYWNAEAQRFEYVDEHGHTMLALEVDGVVEYIGVSSLHQGEEPAPVVWTGMGMMREEAKIWLDLSGEAGEFGPEWRFSEFHCSACHHGQIQVRRRAGATETRCTRCSSAE